MAFVLGIVNPQPLGGVTSNNPGFNNSQAASLQPQVPVPQPAPEPKPQNQGIPIIEAPWHKATPAMKNIK